MVGGGGGNAELGTTADTSELPTFSKAMLEDGVCRARLGDGIAVVVDDQFLMVLVPPVVCAPALPLLGRPEVRCRELLAA